MVEGRQAAGQAQRNGYKIGWNHGRTYQWVVMYCHQIRIGELFVLNTYKDKLCTIIIGFLREIG